MNLNDLTVDDLHDLIQAIQLELSSRAALGSLRDSFEDELNSRGLEHPLDLFLLLYPEYDVVDPEPEDPIEDPDPEPESEPAPLEFAFTRHSPSNRQSYWLSILDSTWANGAFVYWPGPWGHSELKWDSYWEAVVAAHPEGLHTVVSPKTLDEPALIDFCDRLPQAWRDKMIYAYYQEPEDNFTTEAQIANFRAVVKRAGEIVRPYGIRNAVELQEWSLDPINGTYPSGEVNTARFVDPADIDHISWSIYEKNLKNRSAVMIGRIQSFMNLFPDLTWDMSATGVAVPPGIPADDARRDTRAAIVADFLALAKADPRCIGFGWFDFEWTTTLDYRVDPQLEAVFQNFLSSLED